MFLGSGTGTRTRNAQLMRLAGCRFNIPQWHQDKDSNLNWTGQSRLSCRLEDPGTRASGESRTLTLSLEDFGLPCRQTHGLLARSRSEVFRVTAGCSAIELPIEPLRVESHHSLSGFNRPSILLDHKAIRAFHPARSNARSCALALGCKARSPFAWSARQGRFGRIARLCSVFPALSERDSN